MKNISYSIEGKYTTSTMTNIRKSLVEYLQLQKNES